MKSKNASFLAIAASLCLLATAPAAILTSGDFQTGTPTPTLTFSTPITFTITTAGDVENFAFDEWVTSDGSSDVVFVFPEGQTLSYQINSGPVRTAGINNLTDNSAYDIGSLTPNDGYLRFGFASAITVTAGQTLTFLPGSLTFSSNETFNTPPAVFNGNVYLVSSSGDALSNLTSANAVPEPSTYVMLLCGAGVLGFMTLRKRRSSQA